MAESAHRGVVWTLGAFAVTRGFLLVTTIVLARILEPTDFGIVALGLMVVTLLKLVGDLGLGSTIVYRQDLSRAQLGTVLTMMTVTGVVTAVLLAASAPLLARGLREPRLTGVLVALAAVLLLTGVTWFYEQLLVRELEFKRRFLAQLAQSVGYTIIAIAMAAGGAGVWSLVIAQIGGTVAHVAALGALTPYRVRPQLDRSVVRDVFGTSRGFMALGALTFIRQNVDYIAVGRVLGTQAVGHYSMGYRLAELPTTAIADPVTRVTFPAFSRMRAEGEDVGPRFLETTRLLALATVPLGVLLSAAATPLTLVVFGDEWRPMIGVLTALGIWGAIRPVWTALGWLLNSLGRAGQVARLTMVSLVLLLVAVGIAATVGSIVTVAWVLVVEVILLTAIYARIAASHGGPSVGDQLRACRPAMVAGPLTWCAARGAAVALENGAQTVSLAASVLIGSVVYAAVALAVAPGILGETRAQLTRMLGRGRDRAVS